MKILITGVYGFLGFHLANELAKNKKYEVIGLYNNNKKQGLNNNVQLFSDYTLINKKLDIVIIAHALVVSGNINHKESELYTTNVTFTKKLLNHFITKRFIYISSVSVYQNKVNYIIKEDTSTKPQSFYAKTKLLAEEAIINNNINNVIIRLSSLYGKKMKENTLLPIYCNQALGKQEIEIWGKGNRLQNYINIDDAIQLIKNVISFKGIIKFPLLGVSEKSYSNKEIATIISETTKAKIIFIKNDNSPSVIYNNEKTRNILNWKAKTTIKKGIKEYIEWKKR